MNRTSGWLACGLLLGALFSAVPATEVVGDYLETRTCDVYTGPCFANAQVGLAGQQALLAWSIERGAIDGVDVAGLKIVLAVRASDTLGYGGGLEVRPEPIRSVALVDERATDQQRDVLLRWVRQQAGKLAGDVVRVESTAIAFHIDHAQMIAELTAGDEVRIATRRLGQSDCVCTNEEIYYPPLTAVDNAAPALTVEGSFAGRGLGMQWSTPRTRSAFLATFAQ
jgi:hypothetical protein